MEHLLSVRHSVSEEVFCHCSAPIAEIVKRELTQNMAREIINKLGQRIKERPDPGRSVRDYLLEIAVMEPQEYRRLKQVEGDLIATNVELTRLKSELRRLSN